MSRPSTIGRIAAGLTLLAFGLGAPIVPTAAAAESGAGAVTRTRLANGFTVLVRENAVAPVLAISLQVKMGNRWETRANAGISNFLQLMLVRGTTRLDGTQVVEAADRMGGSIDATSDMDASAISATALARYRVNILDLVADVALHPSVPQGTFNSVRDFLVRQVRNRGDKPYFVALDTLTANIYGSHPYAWDSIGLKESLERIDREALLAHYRRHYVPGGIVLAVSGQVTTSDVVAQAERLFGSMPPSAAPVADPPKPPVPAASRDTLSVAGAQAQIVMGRLAPSLTDPDYVPVKVLSSILGGGMTGRLFSDLRDKQGLAYTTAALFRSRVEPSYFLALLGTAPSNVKRRRLPCVSSSSASSVSRSPTRSYASARRNCSATSRWIGAPTRARHGTSRSSRSLASATSFSTATWRGRSRSRQPKSRAPPSDICRRSVRSSWRRRPNSNASHGKRHRLLRLDGHARRLAPSLHLHL